MNEDFCEVCQSKLIATLYPAGSVHYSRLDCPKCGFRGFGRTPNSEKVGTTAEKRIGCHSVKEVCDFHKIPNEICFFCLRKINELGCRETLTVDHIFELSMGGKDIIENQQVLCTACHKLKNWMRTYHNIHFREKEK